MPKEQPTGEVLKSQGLKRSAGATWILHGEAVILKDVKRAQRPLHAVERRPAATAGTRDGEPESPGPDR